jgi:three-Cys-motif partner protein
VSKPPFKPDEVGEWSILKLDIVEKYGHGYTMAFKNEHGAYLKKYYIDGFSGAGVHVVKRTRQEIEGSPKRALNVTPPFDGFHFIDLNPAKTGHLEQLCKGRENVWIHTDDANERLKMLLPTFKYENYKRALCLLDPYGLQLDWEVMQMAGQLGTIDMFLNFPIMDMNRNAFLWKPELADPDDIARMTRFWGDDSWRQVAWADSKQPDMFRVTEQEKQPNKVIAEAFRERLKKVAGFTYVPEPLPMTNRKTERSNGAVSKCAWRRPGVSRSIPASEVLCGFQPCCRPVFSRPILPCARPFGANPGANSARSPPRQRALGYWPERSNGAVPEIPTLFAPFRGCSAIKHDPKQTAP